MAPVHRGFGWRPARRPSPPRTGGRYAVAVGAALPILALGTLALSGPTSAAPPAYPRILRVDTSHPPQVWVDAVVPPLLAGMPLPARAFTVIQDGRSVPITSASRRSPDSLRVMLVLDTAVPPELLAAEQGAARDFLLQLPAAAEVGAVAATPQPTVVSAPGTDRSATVRAVLDLTPQPPSGGVLPGLQLALGQVGHDRGFDAVVAVDAAPTAAAVPAATSQVATRAGVLVYSIALKAPPPGYLGRLVDSTGGLVVTETDSARLLSAYDEVLSDLTGRYRIGYSSLGSGGHTAALYVRSTGVQASTDFVVPGAAAAPTTAGPVRRKAVAASTPHPPRNGATQLAAGVLGALLLGRLGWRLLHRA